MPESLKTKGLCVLLRDELRMIHQMTDAGFAGVVFQPLDVAVGRSQTSNEPTTKI